MPHTSCGIVNITVSSVFDCGHVVKNYRFFYCYCYDSRTSTVHTTFALQDDHPYILGSRAPGELDLICATLLTSATIVYIQVVNKNASGKWHLSTHLTYFIHVHNL